MDRGGEAAAAEDPATLALRAAAPDAVVDAVVERVLEALGDDGAGRADVLGGLDAEAVVGEEDGRVDVTTRCLRHPLRAHDAAPFVTQV